MHLKDAPIGLETILADNQCDAVGQFIYMKLGRNAFISFPIYLLFIRSSRFASKGKTRSGPCFNMGTSWGKGVRVYPFLSSLFLLQYKRNSKVFPYLVWFLHQEFSSYFMFRRILQPAGNFGCAVLSSESIIILGNIYPGNKFSHAILSTSQFLTSLLIILKISGIVLLYHLLVTVKLFTHLAHYTRATT